MNLLRTLGVTATLVVFSFATVNASELTAEQYGSALEADQVVPPLPPMIPGSGGNAYFTLSDTNELSYHMWECFLYPGAELLMDIHGPAQPGEVAPAIFTIPTPDPYQYYRSGVIGVLTNEQLHDLNCGLWYIDVHTLSYPLGEARGQIRGMWGWAPQQYCTLPTQYSTWGAVKSMYR